MQRDELYYFTLLRNHLKPDPRRKLNIGAADGMGSDDVFREALSVLRTEVKVNVHLRFLAAHVLWQSFLTAPAAVDETVQLISGSQPPLSLNTLSIIDTLTSPPVAHSDQRLASDLSGYIFPLSAAELSLLNGFINASPDFASPFLRFILPSILRSLVIRRQEPILDPYQHLFVLKNGLEKLTKPPVNARVVTVSELKELLREIEIKVVRRYWDSRFSGCAELAIDCYRAILHGLEKEQIDVGSMISRYADNNRYPWYLRGKYKLLALLIEYCGLEQLLRCETQLLNGLGDGLTATHVAPFSGAVYKTVLNTLAHKCRHQADRAAEPLKRWTLAVVDYLLSENRLLAAHASKYWVPAVAKFVPDGCRWILDALLRKHEEVRRRGSGQIALDTFVVDSLCNIDLKNLGEESSPASECHGGSPNEMTLIIWACILIRRHARQWLRALPPMEDADWSIGLQHLDDDVRLETFALLLDASGKYAPLSPSQYNVASEFVFDNLIVTSSSFRRRLLAAYGKWFKATVDYFAKQLGDRQDETLLQFRHFVVKSALTSVFDHLFPGANYQRLATTLGVLQSMLDCLKPHAALWTFLDIDRTVTGNQRFGLQLLRCLQNSSDDIRRRSSVLLKTYFKFPFDSSAIDLDVIARVCSTASYLCRSPKAMDCDTGCVIWEVITEKLLLAKQCAVRLAENGAVRLEQVTQAGQLPSQLFLLDLLRIMRFDLAKLRADLRTAAAENPLHGWALVLVNFLETVRTKSDDGCRTITASLRSEPLDMACRVIDFMLTALGSPAEGLCPSLAEMQDAIVSSAVVNVHENDVESDNDEDASIPLGEQLLLACCWLNIKAFAAVLAELAAHSLSNDDDPYPTVNRVGFALFDAMSRTRHFGALEGCSFAFSKYLRLCLASARPEVNEIPMKLLEKVLEHVAAPKHVSVTRRAVGFSIMIECIAVAGCAVKKPQYLEVAFSRLLSITQDGLNLRMNDQDEKSDVNVVRAMHCLRLLLRSSSLDLDVLPYVGACYRLAVHQFSNAVWSIRNSAMLILSSILWRLFGRREVKQDDENAVHSENRMDLVEFCADFADVWKFFCACLTAVSKEGRVRVDSRLFALLSFAQNLIVTDVNENEELAQEVKTIIVQLVELLFRTPDSRLKRLLAEVLANFVPKVGARRAVFFGTVRQYVMGKEGDRLGLSDRMALVHLMNALKLKREQGQIDQKEEDSEIPSSNEPVDVCRWLKRNLAQSSGEKCSVDLPLLTLWVDGNSGLSAQCMALPVLAKCYFGQFSEKDRDKYGMKERFVAFTRMLLRFVDACQIENCRLAAACSFFYLRSSMIAIHKDDLSDEELASANARLVLALRALLSDEDELVRHVAACAFTSGAASSDPLSPVLCLKGLFAECATRRSSLTSRIVIAKLLGADDDVRSAETLLAVTEKADFACGEKNFLFAQHDFNIYKEEYFHLRLCFESLLAQMLACESETRVKSECTMRAPVALVKLCTAALEKMKSDTHLRRRNGERVFVIALRLLLRKRLLDLTPGETAAEDNEVCSSLRATSSQLFGIDD